MLHVLQFRRRQTWCGAYAACVAISHGVVHMGWHLIFTDCPSQVDNYSYRTQQGSIVTCWVVHFEICA